MQYLVVIEQGSSSFGAYVPDLPGCVAVGETRERSQPAHSRSHRVSSRRLKEDGIPIPQPHSTSELIEVRA